MARKAKPTRPTKVKTRTALPGEAILQKLDLKPGDALIARFPVGLSGPELNERYALLSSFIKEAGYGDVPLLVLTGSIVLQVLRREDVERALTPPAAPAPQNPAAVLTDQPRKA